jgi:hypothetical protein
MPYCRCGSEFSEAAAFHAFRMATPEQVIEVRESKKVFDEIKAKRTAHIKQCAHRD